jgi:hypothetical protein
MVRYNVSSLIGDHARKINYAIKTRKFCASLLLIAVWFVSGLEVVQDRPKREREDFSSLSNYFLPSEYWHTGKFPSARPFSSFADGYQSAPTPPFLPPFYICKHWQTSAYLL